MMQYARMEWDPRFNHVRDTCGLSQSGRNVVLITCMGTVAFDLEDLESIETFVKQMTMALTLLTKTKGEYDKAVGK